MLSYLLHYTQQVITNSDSYIHRDTMTYFDLFFVFLLVSSFKAFDFSLLVRGHLC